MAGLSSKTDIQTKGNEIDVIEVFRTAISFIVADEELIVPTEEASYVTDSEFTWHC